MTKKSLKYTSAIMTLCLWAQWEALTVYTWWRLWPSSPQIFHISASRPPQELQAKTNFSELINLCFYCEKANKWTWLENSLLLFVYGLVLCHLPRYSGVPHGSLMSPLSSFANWKSLITILECFKRLKYTKFSNCMRKQIKFYHTKSSYLRIHISFRPVGKC